MRKGAQYWLAATVGGGLLDTLFATVRFQIVTPDPVVDGAKIYTPWHGRILPLAHLHRGQGVHTLISRSADGEYFARLVERWGYQTAARGSSSRGGSTALRDLVKAARAGNSLTVTPDGPRGPKQKLKRGVLTAAQLSQAPLVPVSVGASRAWWIESWDRFLVPKPFARLYVRYGNPVYVPREAGENELMNIEAAYERTLNELTEQADADATRG